MYLDTSHPLGRLVWEKKTKPKQNKKNRKKQVLARMLKNWNAHSLLVGKDSTAVLENSSRVPQTLNIELPYDPSTLLQGIQPKELKEQTQTDTWTPMFTAAFTIAKEWTQPKCLSTDEWIN